MSPPTRADRAHPRTHPSGLSAEAAVSGFRTRTAPACTRSPTPTSASALHLEDLTDRLMMHLMGHEQMPKKSCRIMRSWWRAPWARPIFSTTTFPAARRGAGGRLSHHARGDHRPGPERADGGAPARGGGQDRSRRCGGGRRRQRGRLHPSRRGRDGDLRLHGQDPQDAAEGIRRPARPARRDPGRRPDRPLHERGPLADLPLLDRPTPTAWALSHRTALHGRPTLRTWRPRPRSTAR